MISNELHFPPHTSNFKGRYRKEHVAWTIDSALDKNSISSAAQLHRDYQVEVGDLGLVRIRIWKFLKGRTGFFFTQSHYIKTPLQATPYQSSATYADDEAEALHLAAQTLTSFYDDAVNAGRSPEDSWLVENKYF